MDPLHKAILNIVSAHGYHPLKPKALFRKLPLPGVDYTEFKTTVKEMARDGKIELTKSHTIRPVSSQAAITGTFRKSQAGPGFVRPHATDGKLHPEIYIAEEHIGTAVTGDVVQVRIRRQTRLGPRGEIVRILERATRQFVGTYFERDGEGLVRVDGTVFAHSIYVGDPGAKGVRPEDKVVIEMIRFPTSEDRGEGVITEVLGQRGAKGVDTLSIIRGLGLPEEFPEDVLEEARQTATRFREDDLQGREDFTGWTTITIDPADAHDFDDAVSLTQDPQSKHWLLGVHIADVGAFAPAGSALDREARKRGTSVYLPQRVLPMFPELLSNGLASLQQGKVRYVKSALLDLTPLGQIAHVRFANAAIRVKKRFAYEQVAEILDAKAHGWQPVGEGDEPSTHLPPPVGLNIEPEIIELLFRMRDLALVMHKRRLKRGALELDMPEIELEYDEHGRVAGGHFRKRLVSHRMIEEFMLLANEAVAGHLDFKDIDFLRRVHPAPDPAKLRSFAEFARILGYKIKSAVDRFALQRILKQSVDRPEMHAVHYSLLRSLKQATYSPIKDEHYALASEDYCHFTSPIRRYPDLVVHRLLDQIIRRGKAGSNFEELVALGDHCSKMERRAELAERELVKLKMLTYLSTRLGTEFEVVITGVADYGFFGQAEKLPVEGLVHISTLPDDYYYFDQASHSLHGQRHGRRYRLGDKVHAKVVRVDLQRRQLDLRVVAKVAKKVRPVRTHEEE